MTDNALISNGVSRHVSGTLIDWSLAHINLSADPERIKLAFAPDELVWALRGADALPLQGSDHRPHAIVIALDEADNEAVGQVVFASGEAGGAGAGD